MTTLPSTVANRLPSDVIIPILSFLSLTLYELFDFRSLSRQFKHAIDEYMRLRRPEVREILTAHGLNLNDPLLRGIMRGVPAFGTFDQAFTLNLRSRHTQYPPILSPHSEQHLDRILGYHLERELNSLGNPFWGFHEDIEAYVLNNFNYKDDFVKLVLLIQILKKTRPRLVLDYSQPMGLQEYYRRYVPDPYCFHSIAQTLYPVSYKSSVLKQSYFMGSSEILMRNRHQLTMSRLSFACDTVGLYFILRLMFEKFGQGLSAHTKDILYKTLLTLPLPLLSAFISPTWPILKYIDHLMYADEDWRERRLQFGIELRGWQVFFLELLYLILKRLSNTYCFCWLSLSATVAEALYFSTREELSIANDALLSMWYRRRRYPRPVVVAGVYQN